MIIPSNLKLKSMVDRGETDEENLLLSSRRFRFPSTSLWKIKVGGVYVSAVRKIKIDGTFVEKEFQQG
jgi:hypothetical protein